MLYGTLTSLAIFFISYGVFHDRIANNGLETSSVYFFGTVVAAILVVVVNIEVRRQPFDDTKKYRILLVKVDVVVLIISRFR